MNLLIFKRSEFEYALLNPLSMASQYIGNPKLKNAGQRDNKSLFY